MMKRNSGCKVTVLREQRLIYGGMAVNAAITGSTAGGPAEVAVFMPRYFAAANTISCQLSGGFISPPMLLRCLCNLVEKQQEMNKGSRRWWLVNP